MAARERASLELFNGYQFERIWRHCFSDMLFTQQKKLLCLSALRQGKTKL